MGLNGVKEAPANRERKSIPTEDILKLLQFVLKNNYFEFNGKVKQQLLGLAIGTTCPSPYAFVFMHKVETGFLESEKHKRMIWFHHIDDIIFISIRG